MSSGLTASSSSTEARDCATLAKDFPANDQTKSKLAKLRNRWKDIQAKYAEASKRLGRKIDPARVNDVVARRFINPPDWEAYLQTHPVVNPKEVYSPRPTVWENWLRTAQGPVKTLAQSNDSVALPHLLDWNQDAQMGVYGSPEVGVLKNHDNYGRNILKRDALNLSEIGSLESLGLHFEPLICQEDLPALIKADLSRPECAEVYKNSEPLATDDPTKTIARLVVRKGIDATQVSPDKMAKRWYWFACWPRAALPKNDTERACGMFKYPSVKDVPSRISVILAEAKTFQSCENSADIDSFGYILDAQRRMVALHPFNKGNGRVSRWFMDVLAEKTGLPALIGVNMNTDVSTPMGDYTHEIQTATEKSLETLSTCLTRYESENFEGLQSSRCGMVDDLSGGGP
ncbi:MAG: hypothetical protein ABIR96_06535 [Bdellovibrionota bacterium]